MCFCVKRNMDELKDQIVVCDGVEVNIITLEEKNKPKCVVPGNGHQVLHGWLSCIEYSHLQQLKHV